ncbi:MAG: sulfite exporter TauE/SafE family protein [Candidatus Babeliales bacterium]
MQILVEPAGDSDGLFCQEETMMYTVLFISVMMFVASFIGTVTGFGTGTIMMPIVLLFMPIPEALLLVSVVHWWNNIWRMLFFHTGINLRFCLLFGIPGVALSIVGAFLTIALPSELFLKIFGLVLLCYLFIIIVNPALKLKAQAMTAIIGGACSGLMAGMIGIQGAVRSFFLSAFDLPKEVYIATGALIALLIDTARIGTYLAAGVRFTPPLFGAVALAIPITLLGAYMGAKMVDHIPQYYFRFVVVGALALIGLKFLLFT